MKSQEKMEEKCQGNENAFVKRKSKVSEQTFDLDQTFFIFSSKRCCIFVFALDFFVKIWYNLLKFLRKS